MNAKKTCVALAAVVLPLTLVGCTVESTSGTIGKAMTGRSLTVQGAQKLVADNLQMEWYGINPADTVEDSHNLGTIGGVIDYFDDEEQLPSRFLDSVYKNASINSYDISPERVDGPIEEFVCKDGGAKQATHNVTIALSDGFDLTTSSSVRELEQVLISNGAYEQEFYPEGDGPVEPHSYVAYVAATRCPKELGIMPWQLISDFAHKATKDTK